MYIHLYIVHKQYILGNFTAYDVNAVGLIKNCIICVSMYFREHEIYTYICNNISSHNEIIMVKLVTSYTLTYVYCTSESC